MVASLHEQQGQERTIDYIKPGKQMVADSTSIGITDHVLEQDALPSLHDFLDADPRPTFFVPIDLTAIVPFRIVSGNTAFRQDKIADTINKDEEASHRFRAWCQTVALWRKEYDFADATWGAFNIRGRWRCIRALRQVPQSHKKIEFGLAVGVGPDSLSVEDAKHRLQDIKRYDQRLASLYTMMEMSDVGTFEYSPEGTLIRANDSWYRLSLHPKLEDLHTDYSFMDLVYPPDRDLVIAQWNKLVQGHSITFEMRWKGINYRPPSEDDPGVDDVTWVLSACVPIMDEMGNLVSVAGNTVDINAQKRVQDEAVKRAEALERLRKSEHRFTRFASLAPMGIYILDSTRQLMYCNNFAYEFTGHQHLLGDDVQNINWRAAVFEEDLPLFRKQWETLESEKVMTRVQVRFNRTWDLGDSVPRQVWGESQAFPELDNDGNIMSIFGTMTDISRFKWAEDILKSRVEEALEEKRKHEAFIDMTSHEMRNPLSAVLQCADSTIDTLKSMLSLVSRSMTGTEREQIDSEIKLCLDSLNTITACSLHQKRVIDDVLTLSKMDSNLLAITPVRSKPATIVRDAMNMFEVECKNNGIELTTDKDPSIHELEADWVMIDPSRVLQILINLLTNAIKFTRNRPTRKIHVRLSASASKFSSPAGDGFPYVPITHTVGDFLTGEDWGSGRRVFVRMECSDTGCGLSLAEQSILFNKFAQATPKTHITYGGSGLGLFISKKLAELQGGAIGIRSEPGVGTTFAFFIATRTAPPPERPAILRTRSRTLSQSRLPPNITDIKVEPVKDSYAVLLVEDNIVNQKVLSQQLRKAGCKVHISNHGAEALEYIRRTEIWDSAAQSEPPLSLTVILMDVEMPVMDGLTCTRKIREYQRTGEIKRHVPIIVVSANARGEQVARAREAGADDTIAKPFRILELLPKIKTLVVGENPKLVFTSL
ncbi:hypothetical protein EJ05DRAFT_539647 [Pseudovirgaria hyperparasitica]|uniref:Uncharacterized protein n=1 Tax=Pseudovirgaria hyperparasitica TaxID=470096 RepID=A0A6A6W2G1_9PEZI|nr:uncharacterized protein EJ05DRAFT_539647 [Pseudovirgaria hyperparasitica]KAF2756763.1 hypothetical protein EJ05DRAFT_539647 [Pseudovirgaria hyperparasitica]